MPLLNSVYIMHADPFIFGNRFWEYIIQGGQARKAEDIFNCWPYKFGAEVGRIIRDYGEESNWPSEEDC